MGKLSLLSLAQCLIRMTHVPETGTEKRLHFSGAGFWYVCIMQISDRIHLVPVFHYKSAPLKCRPPANVYREEVSPRRFHTGKMSPPGDISHGKKSPVGGKIIRPPHEESAYPIIIPPTP